MPRGRFITLEGGEGAGKSTQARRIQAWLEARGRCVTLTREPGGAPLAEALRELVLRDWGASMTVQTEALMMFAARAAHLAQTIRPALTAGGDVVCDRFVDSSYAYQGAGKGLPATQLAALERIAVGRLKPDLTLVLDLPPEQGLARAARRQEQNRFEGEALEFMQRVREAFLARAAAQPERCVVIDARGDVEAVWMQIEKVLEQRL